MGRGKRAAALVSRSGVAVVPLSSAPRAPKLVPTFASLRAPRYLGDFTGLITRVVGLHARKTWGLAKKIAAEDLVLDVARDSGNEIDSNAVVCYLPARQDKERVLIGFIDAEDAPSIALELDAGAVLVATPRGEPWAGSDSKGGSLDIEVSLVDEA